jgi:type II secretory pathway pseudopilin PulG
VIAVAVMLVGIGFVAILTAAAAERFMRAQREDERHTREQLDEIIARLGRIERSNVPTFEATGQRSAE